MNSVQTFLKETKFTLISYENNEKFYSVDLCNTNDCRTNELENLIEINFQSIKNKSVFDLNPKEKLAIARVIFQSSEHTFGNQYIEKLDVYINKMKNKGLMDKK